VEIKDVKEVQRLASHVEAKRGRQRRLAARKAPRKSRKKRARCEEKKTEVKAQAVPVISAPVLSAAGRVRRRGAPRPGFFEPTKGYFTGK